MKRTFLIALACVFLSPGIVYAETGNMVTSDLWIGAVINTVERGPVDAVWQKGGEDTTFRGDLVIWGHFYASPSDVTWGSQNNPDLFVKIWFDVGGRIDVNFFHVSVPDIEVYSDYPYDGTADEHGTTTMERRYIRQYYEGAQSHMDENYEDGMPVAGYSQTGNPSGYSTINNLRIGSMINTVEKGPIDAVWRLGGQDTTTRGDQVVWGHFYASPSDVTWGCLDNPDLFVKIWFDVSGRIDVNFFHVSVPEIDAYSGYPYSGTYDQSDTTLMANRYIRHEYDSDMSDDTEEDVDGDGDDFSTNGYFPCAQDGDKLKTEIYGITTYTTNLPDNESSYVTYDWYSGTEMISGVETLKTYGSSDGFNGTVVAISYSTCTNNEFRLYRSDFYVDNNEYSHIYDPYLTTPTDMEPGQTYSYSYSTMNTYTGEQSSNIVTYSDIQSDSITTHFGTYSDCLRYTQTFYDSSDNSVISSLLWWRAKDIGAVRYTISGQNWSTIVDYKGTFY